VNAVCHSFRAGEWCWKIYIPSVSRFERGRDMCVGSVAGSRIDVWCDEEGFTPPLATSKMAYDVTRRGVVGVVVVFATSCRIVVTVVVGSGGVEVSGCVGCCVR